MSVPPTGPLVTQLGQIESGRVVLDLRVVWRRVPYLSSIPDRVILGPRPVRVFLPCTDEDVELVRVVSVPVGVKAVVSSTRELTVRLGDEKEAPGVIDGAIEVATTAEGRGPLRVTVARDAPVLAGQ